MGAEKLMAIKSYKIYENVCSSLSKCIADPFWHVCLSSLTILKDGIFLYKESMIILEMTIIF